MSASTLTPIPVVDVSLRDKILNEVVKPHYYEQIQELTKAEGKWFKLSNVFETISKVFVIAGGIIAFSAGAFTNQYLSFASGVTTVVATGFHIFSSYALTQRNDRLTQINNLLREAGINPPVIPVIDSAKTENP